MKASSWLFCWWDLTHRKLCRTRGGTGHMFYLGLLKWLFCYIFFCFYAVMGQSLGWETTPTRPRLRPLTSITSRTAVYVPRVDFHFALHLTLFYSVYLWSINVPWTTNSLHHDYNFLMTICVLFMQLKLTSLDKILADPLFAHSPETFSKASIQCFFFFVFFITIKLFFQFSLGTSSVERIKHPGGTGLALSAAEVSSGSKDLWKSWPRLLVLV